METITLNLLLVAIILFGTTWGFYKIIKSGWGDSGDSNEKSYIIDLDVFNNIEEKVSSLETNLESLETNLESLKSNTKVKTTLYDDLGWEIDDIEVDVPKSIIDYKSMYKKPERKDAESIRRNTKQIPGELNKDWNKRKKQAYSDARKWNEEQDRLENEFVAKKQLEEMMMKLETIKLQNENLKLERGS
tara:strand:+ start:374 stop:940 length:567 start_codon:yes stop_codon:yes gene_type:complete